MSLLSLLAVVIVPHAGAATPVQAATRSVASRCAAFAVDAETQKAEVRPILGLRVIGTGRLPLYTAPDRRCPGKRFIIPGDRPIAYSARGSWYSVQYTNPKTDQIVDGWIPVDRVEVTGTMGCCSTP